MKIKEFKSFVFPLAYLSVSICVWTISKFAYKSSAHHSIPRKPLPEQLIFIERERFFALNRISGFWNLQKAVLKHFWLLAQNHCQNALFSLRASHFSLWIEYLVFGKSRKPFWSISGSWPKTIARTNYFHCARAIFCFGPNIWFLHSPEDPFKAFLAPGSKSLPERLIFIAREQFFGLNRISRFGPSTKPF